MIDHHSLSRRYLWRDLATAFISASYFYTNYDTLIEGDGYFYYVKYRWIYD